MIVLDGLDNLGKTTFAKRLVAYVCEHYPIPAFYCHMSRPGKAFNFGRHYTLMMTPFAVWDRFHVGGLLWHGPESLTPAKLQLVERILQDFGNVTVLFASENRKAYAERVYAARDRKELFDSSVLVKKNDELLDIYRQQVRHDMLIDPLSNGWPGEETIALVADLWYSRLKEKEWTA